MTITDTIFGLDWYAVCRHAGADRDWGFTNGNDSHYKSYPVHEAYVALLMNGKHTSPVDADRAFWAKMLLRLSRPEEARASWRYDTVHREVVDHLERLSRKAPAPSPRQ